MYSHLPSKFNIRAGTIIQVTPINNQGSFLLRVNFGVHIGTKNTVLHNSPYSLPESLLEKHVCAVISLPNTRKRLKAFNTILLCMPDTEGYYIPIQPDYSIPNGGSLY